MSKHTIWIDHSGTGYFWFIVSANGKTIQRSIIDYQYKSTCLEVAKKFAKKYKMQLKVVK